MKTVKVILILCLSSLLIACSGGYGADNGWHGGGYDSVRTAISSISKSDILITKCLDFSLHGSRTGFHGGGGGF